MNDHYPNLPIDAFDFPYGSDEWRIASFRLRLSLHYKRHELQKNTANKVPPLELFEHCSNLTLLPEEIRLMKIQYPDDQNSIGMCVSALEASERFILQYMRGLLKSAENKGINDLKKVQSILSSKAPFFCKLGLPLAIGDNEKEGAVNGIATTIRKIVYEWYGDSPPHDWLVTYAEIETRHKEGKTNKYRPDREDLIKYLRKIGFEALPDFPRS